MAWQTGSMVLFRLNGEVSSENLSAIQPLLTQVTGGQVIATAAGLHVEGAMEGADARDVNRRAGIGAAAHRETHAAAR